MFWPNTLNFLIISLANIDFSSRGKKEMLTTIRKLCFPLHEREHNHKKQMVSGFLSAVTGAIRVVGREKYNAVQKQ